MAEPFLGEIRLFSYDSIPRGWAICNGQPLPIDQNQALYSLLGTTYGGDGKVNFALPDLRARVPIHFNEEYRLGKKGGELWHRLTNNEMPLHAHIVKGSSSNATTVTPKDNVWGTQRKAAYYKENVPAEVMNPAAVTSTGGNQFHFNVQPYLGLCFCIALQGIYPSQ